MEWDTIGRRSISDILSPGYYIWYTQTTYITQVMLNSLIHPKISHLSHNQLEVMTARYYAGEKIQVLLDEYEIRSSASQFHRLLPPIILPDVICPACNSSMMQLRSRRISKKLIQDDSSLKNVCCSVCDHQESSFCCCDFCRKNKELEILAYVRQRESQVKKYIESKYQTNYLDFNIDNISLRNAVSLLALIRSCGYFQREDDNPSNNILAPLSNASIPFAPKTNIVDKLISSLILDGILIPSSLSPLNAFSYADNEVVDYHSTLILWKITLESVREVVVELERRALSGDWPVKWNDEISGLWYEIAFAECKEYFYYCANERKLPVTDGQSLDSMLSNILRDYSVGQCYRIITSGATYAADYRTRKQCTARHAANYMIGACQRWADRARADGWDVTAYRRNFNLPRSMVSYVLYDVFLKIGEQGFTQTPHSVFQ